jgi:hypothetical protein
MNELLIPKDWAECLPHSSNPVDCRDAKDEMQTLWFCATELFEHARWSIRYQMIIRDHRDNLWITMIQDPATENQEGMDRFLFTRLVDGIEYVVFNPAEAYEVVEVRYRAKPDKNGF